MRAGAQVLFSPLSLLSFSLLLYSSLISSFLDRLTEARIKLRSKDTADHLVTMIFATRTLVRSAAVAASASDYRGWDNIVGVSESSSFNATGLSLNGISSVTLRYR